MNRRSIRHPSHDYHKSGVYFITVCLQDRESLFGSIHDGILNLNDAGNMVTNHWVARSTRFSHLALESFVVMPNHFHAIVLLGMIQEHEAWVQDDNAANPLLGRVIGAFKSVTTRDYITGVRNSGWRPFHTRLWQRNYYERIIRNEREFAYIQEYIVSNPARWSKDRENLDRQGSDEFDEWLERL